MKLQIRVFRHNCFMLFFSLFLALISTGSLYGQEQNLKIRSLTCEYRENPLGVEVGKPRLSWKLETDQRGQKQTGYSLLVASSEQNLNKNIGDIWDSGKVLSDHSLNVVYEGEPLKSRQQYFWKVKLWDKDGQASAWSALAKWSMGILHSSEWKGQWIGGRNETALSDMGQGFRSRNATSANTTKWVQIDLGKEESINALFIYTIKRFPEKPNVTGNHGFPLRFYIEVADNPEMKNAKRVVDFSKEDFTVPSHPKFRVPFLAKDKKFNIKDTKGRYLRLTATKMRADEKGNYWYGMKEIQVMTPTGRNVAASKKVSASESVETDEWGKQNLTSYFETAGSKALMLRKEVNVKEKPVRATAYMCGLGMSELYINGNKPNDHKLDPADTDYRKRVMYVVHDVTETFKEGRNALAVLLGNGLYDINFRDTWDLEGAAWIGPKKLLLQIELEFADGTKQTIVSDPDWKFSSGEIVYNSWRGGESIDKRKTQAGWKQPGFNDSEWKPVVPLIAPQGRLESQKHAPIRRTKEVRPVKIMEPSPGIYVYDMGQNFSGWAKFKASGKSGQKLQLNFSEILNSDGLIDHSNWSSSYIYGRYQTGELILSGKKSDLYEPHFTYYGFQYVQVEGLEEKPSLDDMVGVMVHTDPKQIGDFACSNEKFNRLHTVITHSLLNYVHHRPRDPARERLGWTQDSWQLSEPSYYNFDMALNDRFWFRDMKLGQEKNGHVPPVCPSPNWGNWDQPECMSCPWWGGAMTYGPWFLYQFRGDKALLEELYPHMKASVDFIHGTSEDYIVSWGLGDWGSVKHTPKNLFNTTAFYNLTNIVAQVAELLGKSEDAGEYNRLANTIRDSFNKKFLNVETGSYGVESQAAYALPLLLGMVPEKHKAKVQQHLKDEVKRDNGHLNTGFNGTQALMKVLTEIDPEMAYSIANQEDEPSWWGMIKDGRTTIPEFWNGDGVQNIVNLGGPCENWFYYGLAGIRSDLAYPGFKHFLIKPMFVEDINWVKAHHNSPYGRIAVEWKRKKGKYEVNVTVPANSTARVYLLGKNITEGGLPADEVEGITFLRMENDLAVFKLNSGRYQFLSKSKK